MERKILRKFGFLTDQEGFINRYLREYEGWKVHLERSKNFILKSAANKQKSRVSILGSGWLVDVPFQELSDIFEEIVLIDVTHPRQITHKLQKSAKFKFIEADITGLLEPVYNLVKNSKKVNSKIDFAELKPLYNNVFYDHIQKSDFVVSVNLLNQLDIIICDYIEKSGCCNNENLLTFRKTIQNNHIELLPKGKSTLVTDYEEINIDKNDQVVNIKKLVYGNQLFSKPHEKWTWNFDSNKTYRKDLQTIFKVVGVEL